MKLVVPAVLVLISVLGCKTYQLNTTDQVKIQIYKENDKILETTYTPVKKTPKASVKLYENDSISVSVKPESGNVCLKIKGKKYKGTLVDGVNNLKISKPDGRIIYELESGDPVQYFLINKPNDWDKYFIRFYPTNVNNQVFIIQKK